MGLHKFFKYFSNKALIRDRPIVVRITVIKTDDTAVMLPGV